MNFYLFNPESDFALALGKNEYCPPKNIEKFRDDLSLIPLWYADEDNGCVLTRLSIPPKWLYEVRQLLDIKPIWMNLKDYFDHSHCDSHYDSRCDDRLIPWGWNHSLLREWRGKGRSDQWVDCEILRELSGRQTTIEVLNVMLPKMRKEYGPNPLVVPRVCKDQREVESFLKVESDMVMKMPWSSSGKGLRRVNTEGKSCGLDESDVLWVRNVCRRQGYVVCEKWYDKERDFAMEFCCENGETSFIGYSLFETNQGRYMGNYLMSDVAIKRVLTGYLGDSASLLDFVRDVLIGFINERIAQHYEGCLGIDMMVIRGGNGNFTIHPCVELNLRMNMGIVAHTLYKRYILEECSGRFSVQSFPSNEALQRFQSEYSLKHPLRICKGKIVSGYLPLTPVTDDTTSLAYIIVDVIVDGCACR